MAIQVKIKQIREKLKRIEMNIDLTSNFLKNKSIELIRNTTKLKFIDKAFNDMIIQDLQAVDAKTSATNLIENGITSSQQFNIDYSTMVTSSLTA